MTRIYLAARYGRREELNVYAEELRFEGYIVDAIWLTGDHEAELLTSDDAQLFAIEDLRDIEASDIMINFTEPERTGPTRGGRHVEFGMAHALGLGLIVVGPRENVFHALPSVHQFDKWGPEVIDAVWGALALERRYI